MVAIRVLPPEALARISELDRSERVTRAYVQRGAELEERPMDLNVPPWSPTGEGDHSVAAHLRAWRPLLDRGGTLLGALEGETLLGVAIYRPRLAEDLGDLAVLHVTRAARGSGVGSRLTEEVARLARADGARRLYVSATPSGSTVDFYRRHGFEPTDQPHPEMFALEPEDIHMVREL